MSKPVRHAISVVINDSKGKTLFAKRSARKRSYPLAWSLPSYFVDGEESPEETINRIGKDKLGIELATGKLINEGKSERDDFILFMHDYEAIIESGEPRIASDDYIELGWFEPKKQLGSMKVMGDCCRLYLEYLNG